VRAVIRIQVVGVALVALVGGCSSGPAKEKDAPPQATYRYEVVERSLENKPEFFPGNAQLLLDGKPIGPRPISGLDPKVFTVPASVMLTKGRAKFAMEVESTCGPIAMPLEVETENGTSEEEQRRETDRLVAQKSGWVIRLRVIHRGAWPAPLHRLYLDNVDAAKPATVKVGALGFDVKAGVGPVQKSGALLIRPGFADRRVPVGDCKDGRTVYVDGKAVGEMASVELATLVDINGGHCYVRSSKMYAREGADPSKAPALSKPVAYLAQAGRHVHHVPPVTLFQGGLAEKKWTDDRAEFQEHTELVPVPCDDAKRIAALK
jgi:hypothetical protein